MLGYAYNDIRLTRDVALPGLAARARGDTYGHQFLSSLEAGRTYAMAKGMAATPFAGLTASTLDQASFVESGAGVLNLAVAGETTSSVRSMLGARFDADVEPLDGLAFHARFKLGWAHEFADTDQVMRASFAAAPAGSFTVRGAQTQRDSALVGVGVASQLDRRTSLYLAYEGDLNGHNDAHAIIGGIRISW